MRRSKTIAEYNKRSPERPGFSCPLIDGVQEECSKTAKMLAELSSKYEGSLEVLRGRNHNIRVYARYWKNAAHEIAAEFDKFKLSVMSAEELKILKRTEKRTAKKTPKRRVTRRRRR